MIFIMNKKITYSFCRNACSKGEGGRGGKRGENN